MQSWKDWEGKKIEQDNALCLEPSTKSLWRKPDTYMVIAYTEKCEDLTLIIVFMRVKGCQLNYETGLEILWTQCWADDMIKLNLT